MEKEKSVKINESLFLELEKYKEKTGIIYKKIIEFAWEEYKKKLEIKLDD